MAFLYKKMTEFVEGRTNVTCGTPIDAWQKDHTWMCIVGTDIGGKCWL